MNPLNYASLEASKRLVEAGIILETERYWMHYINESYLTHFHCEKTEYPFFKTPAPSMAEVWREFNKYSAQEFADLVRRYFDPRNEKGTIFYLVYVARTIDALIDLLIWLKKEAADGCDNRQES